MTLLVGLSHDDAPDVVVYGIQSKEMRTHVCSDMIVKILSQPNLGHMGHMGHVGGNKLCTATPSTQAWTTLSGTTL